MNTLVAALAAGVASPAFSGPADPPASAAGAPSEKSQEVTPEKSGSEAGTWTIQRAKPIGAETEAGSRVRVRDHRTGSTQGGSAPRPRSVSDRWKGLGRTGQGSIPIQRPTTRVQVTPRATDAKELLTEVNRIGRSPRLPAKIPAATKRGNLQLPVTVVYGDEIELGGQDYSVASATTARNLLLVAEKIRITGPVTIDLSGRNLTPGSSRVGLDVVDRTGGDLLLMTRELSCEAGGKLTFISRGGSGPKSVMQPRIFPPPPLSPRHGGGFGGSLTLVTERLLLDSALRDLSELQASGCLEVTNPGGTGARPEIMGKEGQVRLYEQARDAVLDLEADDLRGLGFANGLPQVSRWVRHAASKWLLEILGVAVADVRLAGLSSSGSEAVRRLRRAVALADGDAPLLNEDREEFDGRLVELVTLHDRFAKALWADSLSLTTPSGFPRRVELFTEGRDLRTRIAPTEALVVPRFTGGRQVLGLVEFDPRTPDSMRLELEVELALDPLLAQATRQNLEARGEEFGGAFRGWELTARPIRSAGVLDSEIELAPSGASARVTLTIDTDAASLVLARLATRSGLPLRFDWTYRDDRNVSGVWDGPSLSLHRRAAASLDVGAEGQVTNLGPVEVTLEYIELADGSLRTLEPELTLAAGGVGQLSLPGDVLAGVRVPPQAVVYSGADPFRLESDFQVIGADDLVETITVTNRLGHDETLGGGLEFVEVFLEYGSDTERPVTAGPYRLAPVGADGHAVSVSFVKAGTEERSVRVSGTAFFEAGSRQSLLPTTFEDLSIALTRDLLPEVEEVSSAP